MSERTTDAQIAEWRKQSWARVRASDLEQALLGAIGAAEAERARADKALAHASWFAAEADWFKRASSALNYDTTCVGCGDTIDKAYGEYVRADKAESRIATVRALHKPDGSQWVAGKAVPTCYVCGDFWPCATVQALDGDS